MSRIKGTTTRVRSRHLFVLDVAGLMLGSLAVVSLWLDASPSQASLVSFLWVAGIIVATQAAVNILLGLYSYSWRFASVADMGRIIACVSVGGLASALIVTGVHSLRQQATVGTPALFWVLMMSIALVVLALPRFGIRAATDLRTRGDRAPVSEAHRTLLYGAGWAGVVVARSALRGPKSEIIPVGFLDRDPDLAGQRVAGLYVFGDLKALRLAVRKTKATVLLITMPRASGKAVRRVAEAALEHGLEVRTVPPVSDLIDGSLDASRVRQLRVEDLLRRPLASTHSHRVDDVFEGQTVMITGAGGSIGSELARQVVGVNPRKIVLVDQAESPLYMITRETRERLAEHKRPPASKEAEVSLHLANVADRAAVQHILETERPDVILHAAAYKHVPMLEDHVSRAVDTNIGGTLALVDAAAAAGVEHFVLVSTDKAVWPSSVMGASKRVAEMIVADAGRRLGRPYISVRFGNVLGSNGSVVPIFQEQLEKGRPLTITDPEMTRYFMTIPEAAWLILDAVSIADGSGLYVLDMGEPVRIIDIARDVAALAGRDPDSVPIKVVGLRSGEKLHEELFYDDERVHPTDVPKVMRSDPQEPPEDVRDHVNELLALATGDRDDELAASLHVYVRESVQADEARWGDHCSNAETSARNGRHQGAVTHVADERRRILAGGTRPVATIAIEGNGHGRTNGRNGSHDMIRVPVASLRSESRDVGDGVGAGRNQG